VKVLHLTPYFSRKGTGISNIVRSLAKYQVQQGCDVRVFAAFDEFSYEDSRADLLSFDCRFFKVWGPKSFYYCPDLVFHMINFNPDIIHSHGLWTYFSWAGYKASEMLNVPHVVNSHGALNQWFLGWKKTKKQFAREVYQKKILKKAGSVQCHESEWDGVVDWGVSEHSKIYINGTDESTLTRNRSRDSFSERHPELKNKKILLFISRIHPQKGLIPLLRGFAAIKNKYSDWQLVVAGADEYGYLSEVKAEAIRLGLSERVNFVGYVNNVDKWHYYLAADGFALMSHGEGFSMAILEALAAGAPVCISKYCFFDEAQQKECGFVCDLNTDSVSAALEKVMTLDDLTRKKMGENGRALIREKYLWEKIVSDLILDYEDIIVKNRNSRNQKTDKLVK